MRHFYTIFFCIVIICSGLSAAYTEHILQDNPVAFWRFDDHRYNHGCEAKEFTGNIESSIFQDDAMIVEGGINGRCGWFNGNKAGIDIGNCLGQLLDGSSAVTFEAWIRSSVLPETNSAQRIFAMRIDGARAGLDISLFTRTNQPPTIRVGARSSSEDPYLVASAPFSVTEQWVHLVCVLDFESKRVRFYYDGVFAEQVAVNFSSDVFVLGDPTQSDQIGRAPDLTNPYRGYIDEVAIYNKALTLPQIQLHYSAGNPAEPADLWVSQIVHDETRMVHSPSLYISDDGVMLTSYDNRGNTYVKISYDKGKTWLNRSVIENFRMASLFEHNGAIYLLGISQNPGHICIAKTTNYGLTWNDLTILEQAQQPGVYGYHTAPVPVVTANGRIFRVFEQRYADDPWPTAYSAVVYSAPDDSDLMSPQSWRFSNFIEFDPSWFPSYWHSTDPGWLEGNVVQAPDGSLNVLMRLVTRPVVDKTAILSLSEDGKILSFDPQTGIIDMPGGMHKFDIHRDPVTGKYLTLNNNNTDISRPNQRNTLSLIASDDLIYWYHVKTILQDNSPMTWTDSMLYSGFQYVVWQFDGDDIIFASRTAYDGAPNWHDSNRITFHRIENYLDIIAPCGDWGYLSKDLTLDCFVGIDDLLVFSNLWLTCYDMLDFSKLYAQWLSCTQPYVEGCFRENDSAQESTVWWVAADPHVGWGIDPQHYSYGREGRNAAEKYAGQHLRASIEDVNLLGIADYAVMLGDLVADSKDMADVFILEMLRLQTPQGWFYTLGNHDFDRTGDGTGEPALPVRYRAETVMGIRCIFISTGRSGEIIGQQQKQWFWNELEKYRNTPTPIFIFSHHPYRNIDIWDQLQQSIHEYNIVAWFNAHLHRWDIIRDSGYGFVQIGIHAIGGSRREGDARDDYFGSFLYMTRKDRRVDAKVKFRNHGTKEWIDTDIGKEFKFSVELPIDK